MAEKERTIPHGQYTATW